MKLENSETVTDVVQVKKAIEAFYQSLYTFKFADKGTQVSNYDKKYDDFIPQLSEEDQEHLETELTLEELKDALASFANNKSPGEDGFTKEFYESFFDLLWKDLLNSYNEAFHKGELSISQRTGILTLIPKEDINFTDLKNWRPISLLNLDYKILSKILAKRLEQFLPNLIHSDQTGFVRGRYIGQNIRLLSDIMEFSNDRQCPGILLFVDFEKAFDTLEWSFISKTLETFNFGPNFRKWFSVLYNNEQSSVLNGGYTTNYFQISRGVRQWNCEH